jgi:hypothetical protein
MARRGFIRGFWSISLKAKAFETKLCPRRLPKINEELITKNVLLSISLH